MNREFMLGYVMKLERENKENKKREDRENEIVRMEAEQAGEERVLREANALIEPDFDLKKKVEFKKNDLEGIGFEWKFPLTKTHEKNKNYQWFKEKTISFIEFMRVQKGVEVKDIPAEMDKALLRVELEKWDRGLWSSNVDDWFKSQLFFKSKLGAKKKTN